MITKQDFDFIKEMIERALNNAIHLTKEHSNNEVSISITDINFIVISLKIESIGNDNVVFLYENNNNTDSKWIIKQTLLDLSDIISTMAYTYYPLTIEYSCNLVNIAMEKVKKQLILFSDNLLEQSVIVFD